MSRTDLEVSTLQPTPGAISEATLRVPSLTVLHHPDLSRVGEQARLVPLLEHQVVELSRLAPDFVGPGGGRAQPLADPFLSRRAIRFEPEGSGIRLVPHPDVELGVDGDRLQAQRSLGASDLDRGVVLELGQRVVLLLHWLGLPTPPRPAFGLVGQSPGIERVRESIARVADLDVHVLLRGETGTGKELVAKALHQASPRAKGPFVALNMAAVPASMAASELFGHAAGAFTGAVREHLGHFAQAQGGTLFLDEIGETPPEVQPMLLRVLETGETTPLGSSRRQKLDVRLICATDLDLEAAISTGDFRDALFHRIAGFQLRLPPLRERRDDLGRLLRHFLLEELAATGERERLERPGKQPWLPASLVVRMAMFDWPGNVRQLRNVVRQLVISSRGQPTARIDDCLGRLLASRPQTSSTEPATTDEPGTTERRDPASLGDEELVATLKRTGWRVGAAAKALGLSRTTLYALIERSPRLRKAKDIPDDELRRCQQECADDLDAMAAKLEVSRRALQLRLKQ